MELCKTCNAGCCRRYNPFLWGSDIIRICEALKVDINFFTSVVPIEGDKVDELMGKEPMFKFTDAGDGYYILVLKLNESKYHPGTSKCMFMQEWSAEAQGSEELKGIIGRCGIYSIRPINCRAWPAKYDPERKKVIIRDPHLLLEKEHKLPDNNPVYSICKRPLTHEDYAIYEEEYAQDAIYNYHEKEFFVHVAQKWNQNPDVSDNLYDFLIKEYANRIELINKQ